MPETLLHNLQNTGFLEVFAVLTGLASVWYARRENVLVYPVGIVSVLIYVWLCFHAGLYADMGINAFYFWMSVYGWVKWTMKVPGSQTSRPITFSGKTERWACVLATLVFTVVLYFVLTRYTDSTVPLLDSFSTAVFIVAMWLMALKRVESWVYWIIGDVVCMVLFPYKGLVFSGFQYLVFLVLAVAGYVEWKKRWKINTLSQ